jgi:hypothetical protein
MWEIDGAADNGGAYGSNCDKEATMMLEPITIDKPMSVAVRNQNIKGSE